MKTGVYVHIPFCRSKCFYCDFLSFACPKKNSAQDFDLYLKKLLSEINNCVELKKSHIETIFFGGGTPSILPHEFIYKILDAIYKNSLGTTKKNPEITIESNPESLNQEKICAYKSYGINRISIGLQVIQDKFLKKIGRAHNFKTFEQVYAIAKKYFDNINIDLIFALPDQNLFDWEENLIYIKKIQPAHFSAYSLIIEKNTKFYFANQKNKLNLPDESIERQMYHSIKKILCDYKQYEISNWSREKKFECKHNKIYWQLKNYLGFGLGAHSFFNNTRWHNTNNLKKYLTQDNFREEIIKSTRQSLIEEFIFLGLRLNQGINKNKFKKKFGCEIKNIYHKQISLLTKQKLLSENKSFIFLTDYGRDLANYAMSNFIL